MAKRLSDFLEDGRPKKRMKSVKQKFDGIPNGCNTTGSITLSVSALDFDHDHRSISDLLEIANCFWQLSLEAYNPAEESSSNSVSSLDDDNDYLRVDLMCKTDLESMQWAYKTKLVFILKSQSEEGEDFCVEGDFEFNYFAQTCSLKEFISWKDLRDPDKGYVKNDDSLTLTVLVKISVEKIEGLQNMNCVDFTVPNQLSDGVIKIGDVQYHINKFYLASYSPYFEKLFFGDFSESQMKSITLNDVDNEEFIEFLHVIYPSHINITKDNVEFLLELGDKFQVQHVMKICEEFLIDADVCEIPLMLKLILVGKYRLARLEDSCVTNFTSIDEFRNFRQSEDESSFQYLTDKTKAALFHKLLKLI